MRPGSTGAGTTGRRQNWEEREGGQVVAETDVGRSEPEASPALSARFPFRGLAAKALGESRADCQDESHPATGAKKLRSLRVFTMDAEIHNSNFALIAWVSTTIIGSYLLPYSSPLQKLSVSLRRSLSFDNGGADKQDIPRLWCRVRDLLKELRCFSSC